MIKLVTLATALLISATTLATQPDFQQPLSIDSDTSFGDIQTSTLIYEHNVIVQQGSLKILADRLEIDGSAGEGAEIFIATGTPATYSQMMEDGSLVEAKANEIRFERADRVLTMTGDAELKQRGSLVRATLVRYNIETQQLNAERGEDESGRVRTVFEPSQSDPKKNATKENQQP
ncbi:MAG: lipopolysaccharide transport periplasmic protein LptA [Alkalimonas sp.]|nr:lipopolysaccharide transport periplasmic protein LptA [Alkalimonas sp.]